MTHDELIAYIDDSTNGLKHEHLFEKLLANTKALRAVVELHKPISGWQDGVEIENHHCSCDEWDEYDAGYPCETIQAIEEQLR
jgi:hypothetical protein